MASDEKVLQSSDIAYDSSLDLFEVPVSNLGVAETKFISFKASNAYNIEGNIKFRIPAAGNCYLDLRELYIKTTVRIVKGNGQSLPPIPSSLAPETPSEVPSPDKETPPTRPDKKSAKEEEAANGMWRVGPVAYLAHSLWDGAEVRFNDCVVHGGQTGYPYRAILNTLLGENDLTDEELQCGMFIKDTAGNTTDVNFATTSNLGLLKRTRMMAESRTVELLSKPDIDIFKVNKALINGVSIDLTLVPTSAGFRLLSPNKHHNDFVLEIVDISLEVKMISPSSQVLVAHQSVMQNNLSRARYFYLKEDIRKYSISAGSNAFYIEDAFNGKVPNKLVLFFIASDALAGRMHKNPYSFEHFKLTYLNVSISGRPSPAGALSYDFENGKYIRGYMDLYSGKQGPACNSQRITLEEFTSGYSIFRVILNTQSESEHFPSAREGSVRLECRFAEQLEESIIMMAHITLPGCYEIDFNRTVHTM